MKEGIGRVRPGPVRALAGLILVFKIIKLMGLKTIWASQAETKFSFQKI